MKSNVDDKRYEGSKDSVHPYDRHSGTGTIKPEFKKGGYGKFNTGRPEDDVKEEDKAGENDSGYRHERRPRRKYEGKEEEKRETKEEPVTVSYKDILKAQTKPVVEEKKEVKKVELPKGQGIEKEVKIITKKFDEDMHTAKLEGETGKLAGLHVYEKAEVKKEPQAKKSFKLIESDFPALC